MFTGGRYSDRNIGAFFLLATSFVLRLVFSCRHTKIFCACFFVDGMHGFHTRRTIGVIFHGVALGIILACIR